MRQRKLTANEKAAELFFQRNLPPGWVYDGNEQQATLRRLAPVYTLTVPAEDYLTHSKARLLDRARNSGKKHTCEIKIKVERHDDPTRMRQKLRLYENVRRDIVSAWNRLQVSFLSAHSFHTQTNRRLRTPVKERYLEELQTLVSTY